MNSIQIVSGVRRSTMPMFLAAVLSLSFLNGCGNGGDDDSKKSKPKNTWDEMRWDEGKWGATETQLRRIVIG
jgi:hypothetical protein